MNPRKLFFWIMIACILMWLLYGGVVKVYSYNDLDKIPKIKESLAKKLEKAGVLDACSLLSDDRIRLHPELFKAIIVKCPKCGTQCKYKEQSNGDEFEIRKWVCPKCGWERELPDTYGRIFTAESIMRGKKFIADNEEVLSTIQAKYDVSKEIIAAVTRVETNFGNFLSPTMSSTGQKLEVINALLSHVIHGKRRRSMFENEFITWMKICRRDNIDPYNIGSTCGAFGIVQFMPTSYEKWAVDWDGDGRIDLYKVPDAMASCANYLKVNGWRQDKSPSWYRAIMAYNASRSYTNAVLKYSKEIKTWKVMKYEKVSGE
jgi:hypothetical protein